MALFSQSNGGHGLGKKVVQTDCGILLNNEVINIMIKLVWFNGEKVKLYETERLKLILSLVCLSWLVKVG